MEFLVTSREMKCCDAETIDFFGVPSMVLMERAALAVVEELTDGAFDLTRILVVCGSGNNGGDGFAVARLLMQRGLEVDVLFAGKESSLTKDAAQQKHICEQYGIKCSRNRNLSEYTCIVDALLGVGLSGNVRESAAEVINAMNEAKADVLAVDIASGISADTGAVCGTAVRAKKTVTFAFRKIGHVLYPGAEYSGTVVCKEIGITEDGFRGDFPKVKCMSESDVHLPQRIGRANKGTYGKAAVIAGSRNMSGAAYLAGTAAYRMGSGLVRICTEECNRVILQTTLPEAVLTTYCDDNAEEKVREVLGWATAAAAGPGLGMKEDKEKVLNTVFAKGNIPLVLDADVLNILAAKKDAGRIPFLKEYKAPVVVTPHIGEMSRLTGLSTEEIAANLIEVCRDFAKEYGVICVLKDARTVISDGEEVFINQSGNEGMATGGSGDVLTGMIVGLLAQNMPVFIAAVTGVYLHGLAGDEAGKRHGSRSMLAGNITEELETVLQRLETGKRGNI